MKRAAGLAVASLASVALVLCATLTAEGEAGSSDENDRPEFVDPGEYLGDESGADVNHLLERGRETARGERMRSVLSMLPRGERHMILEHAVVGVPYDELLWKLPVEGEVFYRALVIVVEDDAIWYASQLTGDLKADSLLHTESHNGVEIGIIARPMLNERGQESYRDLSDAIEEVVAEGIEDDMPEPWGAAHFTEATALTRYDGNRRAFGGAINLELHEAEDELAILVKKAWAICTDLSELLKDSQSGQN